MFDMFKQYDEYILYKQNMHKIHQIFSKKCLTYSEMSGSMSTSKNKRQKPLENTGIHTTVSEL